MCGERLHALDSAPTHNDSLFVRPESCVGVDLHGKYTNTSLQVQSTLNRVAFMAEQMKQGETSETEHHDSVEKVRELISDIKVAMLTTTDATGGLHSRPMYTQQTEFDGDIWFATSKSSSLVTELQHNSAVLVNYANPESQRFVVVTGNGVVVRDQAKIDELWNPALKMWFSGGPTDPDLTLVRIESRRADFWDSPAAPVRWFQFLTGVATGKRPSGDTRGAVELV
jgi:general stress protein 26